MFIFYQVFFLNTFGSLGAFITSVIVMVLIIIDPLNTLGQSGNLYNITGVSHNVNIGNNGTHNNNFSFGNESELTGSIASHHPTCYKSDQGYWCFWKP